MRAQVLAMAIGSASVVGMAVLPAQALTTTYNDSTTFLNNVAPGSYLESFNSATSGGTSRDFSGNGFAYTVSVVGSGNLYSSTGNTGSRFFSLDVTASSLLITFTSGNVTAVGGNFFLTDISDNVTAGGTTLTLSDGTTVNLTSPSSTPLPFTGFTTDGPIITGLTFAPLVSQYVTLDNLVVGQSTAATPVPAPPQAAGFLVMGGLQAVRQLRRRLFQSAAKAV